MLYEEVINSPKYLIQRHSELNSDCVNYLGRVQRAKSLIFLYQERENFVGSEWFPCREGARGGKYRFFCPTEWTTGDLRWVFQFLRKNLKKGRD